MLPKWVVGTVGVLVPVVMLGLLVLWGFLNVTVMVQNEDVVSKKD
jgi:hypothetical protein